MDSVCDWRPLRVERDGSPVLRGQVPHVLPVRVRAARAVGARVPSRPFRAGGREAVRGERFRLAVPHRHFRGRACRIRLVPVEPYPI